MSQDGARVDFARLYAELGVAPDGGLDAFRRAYRRRVAELHPDRPATRPRDPAQLIALNLGYAAVLDFHRDQGRIPGEPVAGPRVDAAAGDAPALDSTPGASRQSQHRARPPRFHGPGSGAGVAAVRIGRHPAPRIRVLALPVLLVIAAIWRWYPEAGTRPAAPHAALPAVAREHAPTRGNAQLGMDRPTVAELLGEPVARDAANLRWVYGPSWLRFECGRLVDWYSSPLRPLRVEARRPSREDRALHASRSMPCLEPTDLLARDHRGDR